MRVTNGMLSNNMMLGLNKNMNRLNTLYDQMNSLKKIQRPSDDPIILGRSLKLRLNVLETEQYKTNVGEARSWMEISEGSIENTHGILNDIRKECAQAANGTLDVNDRKKIMTTIEQLKKQMIQESNANYAGRNVFGGYKTDQKVLFDKNQEMDPPAEFEQSFGKDDLEIVTYKEDDYYRIRLPYGDVSGVSIEGIPDVTVLPPLDPAELTPIIRKSTDIPTDGVSYYYPQESVPAVPGPPAEPAVPGRAYFLEDTGELIINKETYDAMMKDNATAISINYQKAEFKEGEPNPDVFFNSTPGETTDDSPVYTSSKDPQKIEYEIGIGTKLDINVLGKDIFNPSLLRNIDELIHVLGTYESVEEGIKGTEDTEPNRQPKETINLSKLFSNGIGKMDKALKSVSGQQADLGSRMKRLELTEKRLGDDEISYTELLSRTEDVELERAFIDFNTQYAVYQSALQVTAKVVQPTLMDFLR